MNYTYGYKGNKSTTGKTKIIKIILSSGDRRKINNLVRVLTAYNIKVAKYA